MYPYYGPFPKAVKRNDVATVRAVLESGNLHIDAIDAGFVRPISMFVCRSALVCICMYRCPCIGMHMRTYVGMHVCIYGCMRDESANIDFSRMTMLTRYDMHVC